MRRTRREKGERNNKYCNEYSYHACNNDVRDHDNEIDGDDGCGGDDNDYNGFYYKQACLPVQMNR